LKFIAGQDKPWIVCEDDAIIPSDLMLRITDLLPKVPYSDKGMILFHAICSNPAENAKALKCTPIGNGVSKTNQFWSTLCYYMPPSTAKILLEHAGTPPYDMEIDAKMGDIAQQGLIDIYVANIVENGWPDSDIQVSAKYYKPTDGGKN
jgi:GR25 family glycosyltransferase involved in LPS biosynthesis